MNTTINSIIFRDKQIELTNGQCELFGLTFTYEEAMDPTAPIEYYRPYHMLFYVHKGVQVTLSLIERNGFEVCAASIHRTGDRLGDKFTIANVQNAWSLLESLDESLLTHLEAINASLQYIPKRCYMN